MWSRVAARGLSTAVPERTWGEWAKVYQQPLFNVGIGFFGFIMSSQIVKMKYEKSEVELELKAAKAELETLRTRLDSVEPLAAKLRVDPGKLRALLADFLQTGGGEDAARSSQPKFV